MEKEIIKEINELRGNPSEYVQKLIKNKQYFQNGGKNWKHPDFKASIKTEEGPAAYDEAIDFLKSHSASLEHLTPSKGLNKIALEFLRKFQKDANEDVELGPIVEKHGEKYKILAIVGNKCDLYEDEEVEENEANSFSDKIGAKFFLVSAKNGDAIEDMFKKLADLYLNPDFKDKLSESKRTESIKLDRDKFKNHHKNNGCC